MNYKKLSAAALALLLMSTAVGCGKDETSESGGNTSISAVSDTKDKDEESSSKADKTDDKDESSKSDDKKDESSKSDNSDEDDKKDKDKTEDTTTATKAAGGSAGSSGSSGSSGNSGGSGNSGNSGNSGGSGNSGNSGNSAKTTAASNSSAPSATTPAEEEKTYDAEITFNGGSVTVKGSNAKAEGMVVRITAGGDYIVRGSCSDGQIYVNTPTEEKVDVTLDGVDITCSSGPAVFIDNAKKCTLKLAAGSSNYLSDTNKDKVNDGVIFSNDTLRIKGSGSLEIHAGNAHGIASDDDVIIENGTFYIESKKSGIFAHDDITVNGGDLTIFGGTNGIKSKGTLNVNGGQILAAGGSKEEKSSIYSEAGFYYTDGYVYAAGNMVTAPSDSPTPYIVVKWNSPVDGDTEVGFVLDGSQRASITPRNSFRCILMMSPDIYSGASFAPYVGGDSAGDFDVADGMNLFEAK